MSEAVTAPPRTAAAGPPGVARPAAAGVAAAAALVRRARAGRSPDSPGGGDRAAAAGCLPARAAPPAGRAQQPLCPRHGGTARPATATSCCSACASALPPRLAPALIGRAETARWPGGRSTRRCTTPGSPSCSWSGCARPGTRRRRCASSADPASDDPGRAGAAAADRRAVQLLARLRRHVHPEALPPGRARAPTPTWSCRWRWPAQGCPRVPAPVGLVRGPTRPGGEPYVLGVLQPFLHGAADGWAAGAARAGRGRRLHRRGARAGPGHRRGAHRAGRGPAHGRPGPRRRPGRWRRR